MKSYYDKRLVALFHHHKRFSLLVSGFQASKKEPQRRRKISMRSGIFFPVHLDGNIQGHSLSHAVRRAIIYSMTFKIVSAA